jgi:uncharacterized OsmC-like protein
MMKETEKIKTALERCKKAFTLKPALGRSSAISTVRIQNGLACEITEGNWKFYADMPEGIGGNNTAPTPGVYGRAALGSCLAIGYMMKAAELGVAIKNLEVAVEADFDDGALLGTADPNTPPGYLEVRYTITIESDESEEKIMQMLDDGDKHSPYLDVFSRAQQCVRNVNIVSTKMNN